MITRRAMMAAFAVPVAGRTLLLREASARALAYTRELPDFICTEIIRRSDNVRNVGWKVKDLLEVQVGVASHREYYKLLKYNSAPTTLSYRSVGGALTEGEFGSLLREIFQPGIADFQWKREMLVSGRSLEVFDYHVPQKRATYHLEFGYRSGEPQSLIVGHKGEVWIDSESSRAMRIEQTAEIPRSFPLKVSKTTLQFGWVEIGGEKWLLPHHASSLMGTGEVMTNNEVIFSDYRKFTADSKITFDAPEATSPKP